MKTMPLVISDDHAVFDEVSQLPLETWGHSEVLGETERRHHAVSELKTFQPELVSVDTGLALLDEAPGSSPGVANGKANKVPITKTILRHKRTGLYFAPEGGWVSDWRKARHISDPTNIMATCKAHELPRIEFILKSEADDSRDYSIGPLRVSTEVVEPNRYAELGVRALTHERTIASDFNVHTVT